MKFADPLSVQCLACGEVDDYSPRELLALRATCHRCSASLEAIGRDMRSRLAEWGAYLGRVELAIELERTSGGAVTDADLDAMARPIDFVPSFAENEVIAALGRVLRAPVAANDVHRTFLELFAPDERA